MQEFNFKDKLMQKVFFTSLQVPLWICSVLVVGYVIGGSFLFTEWEHWRLLDSAYFCFVTLTTIGFGDFVPKARANKVWGLVYT